MASWAVNQPALTKRNRAQALSASAYPGSAEGSGLASSGSMSPSAVAPRPVGLRAPKTSGSRLCEDGWRDTASGRPRSAVDCEAAPDGTAGRSSGLRDAGLIRTEMYCLVGGSLVEQVEGVVGPVHLAPHDRPGFEVLEGRVRLPKTELSAGAAPRSAAA